jgi:hypothetical protein
MPISRKNVQTLKDFVEVKTWTIDVKTEKKTNCTAKTRIGIQNFHRMADKD